MDLRKVSGLSILELVSLSGDVKWSATTVQDGWDCYVTVTDPKAEAELYDEEEEAYLPKVRPHKGRSTKITLDMIHRMWHVHKRMYHVSLRVLTRMAFNGDLG